MQRRVRLAAVFTTTAILVGAPALAATAITVDPGDGAVLYNADLTPIGSELTYTGGLTQPEYTFASVDDDYWGLDAQGLPANDNGAFADIASGIPLGFTVNLGGVSFDGAIVNTNGSICLTSSTDATADPTAADFECWFYAIPPAHVVSEEHYIPGSSSAYFSSVGADHFPQDDNPVDTDADSVNDACALGGFYVVSEDACTSVFWGTTTYDGKPAFVATWYFAPDIVIEDDTDVVQLVLVSDGNGDATVMSNVDRFFNYGYDLDYWDGEEGFEACTAANGAGDDNQYIAMGGAYRANGVIDSIDLFGPACIGGLTPTTQDQLIDGAPQALNEHSFNSTQPGRYIFYVRAGQLESTLAGPAVTPAAPTLPDTGAEAQTAVIAAVVLLALGALGVARARRRSIEA